MDLGTGRNIGIHRTALNLKASEAARAIAAKVLRASLRSSRTIARLAHWSMSNPGAGCSADVFVFCQDIRIYVDRSLAIVYLPIHVLYSSLPIAAPAARENRAETIRMAERILL